MESLRVETEATFRVLYDESYCQIYRIAYGMLRNEHDAWDVLQNVYIKALLKSDSLHDPSKIKGWMVQITYNECKNVLKSRRRSMFRFYNDVDVSELDEHTQIESEEMNPVDFSEISEVREELMGLMDKLPELQRQVISMYYYEQNSIEEIAEKLGCSTGTVKSRLNYAKKKLKSLVCEYETVNNTTLRCGFLFSLVQGVLGVKQAVLATSTAVAAVAACCTGVVVYEHSVPEINDTYQPVAEIEYAPAEAVTTENITAEVIETVLAQVMQTEAQTEAQTEIETTVDETTVYETQEPEQTTIPETIVTEAVTVAETKAEVSPPLPSNDTHDNEDKHEDSSLKNDNDRDDKKDFGGYWGNWYGGFCPQMMHPQFFWWKNWYGCNGYHGNWNDFYYGIPGDRDHQDENDDDEHSCESNEDKYSDEEISDGEKPEETPEDNPEEGEKSESENCPFDSDHIH